MTETPQHWALRPHSHSCCARPGKPLNGQASRPPAPRPMCGVFVQCKEGVSSVLLHNKLPHTKQLKTVHTDVLTVPVGQDSGHGQLGPPLQGLT